MHLNFAKYIGGMLSYMPSPAFGGRYALDITNAQCSSDLVLNILWTQDSERDNKLGMPTHLLYHVTVIKVGLQ